MKRACFRGRRRCFRGVRRQDHATSIAGAPEPDRPSPDRRDSLRAALDASTNGTTGMAERIAGANKGLLGGIQEVILRPPPDSNHLPNAMMAASNRGIVLVAGFSN
jgi:hypothetical protein